MTPEEAELAFVGAGWEIACSSSHLIVGDAGGLSILAYGSQIGSDDPAFELLDRERNMAYWVRVVPSPRVAAVLLGKHGGPPEQQRGNLRER